MLKLPLRYWVWNVFVVALNIPKLDDNFWFLVWSMHNIPYFLFLCVCERMAKHGYSYSDTITVVYLILKSIKWLNLAIDDGVPYVIILKFTPWKVRRMTEVTAPTLVPSPSRGQKPSYLPYLTQEMLDLNSRDLDLV